MIKESYIKKLPNGLWRVYSESGKNLGTCKTKEKAKKRLKQVEFFKHKKASIDFSYSYIVRELNKNNRDLAINFIKSFKKIFDEAYLSDIENFDKAALMETMQENDIIGEIK
jgi:hypothetical protein